MFPTFGAHQISSITELRQDTNHLLDHADETGQAILLQRNNDPVAVLISVDTFRDLVNRAQEGGAGRPDAV
jgi:prevent-host-death family protein